MEPTRRITPEAALLERIGLPEEVELFEEFEELARTYTIEAPFVGRSQIELMFDVYDGRKLSQGGGSSSSQNEAQQPSDTSANDYKLSLTAANEAPAKRQQQSLSRRSVSGLKAIAKRGKRQSMYQNLTWCKLLFAHQRQHSKQSVPPKKSAPGFGVRCCVSRSDTQGQDLWLSPSASSTSGGDLLSAAKQPEDEYLAAALLDGEPPAGDQEEEAELRAEVVQLIGPLLHRLRRNSTLSLDESGPGGALAEQQPQVIQVEGSLAGSGRISVCLFDMRHRTIQVKCEAENGRRWARIASILDDLRWRFRSHNGSRFSSRRELSAYFEQRHLSRAAAKLQQNKMKKNREQHLSREQFDRLIAMTKDSLNHLIDAQLLLRNKLSQELQAQQQSTLHTAAAHLQPQQQQACLIARENEYESLLRQNFNLLKVWQNLEETKRLACFVCEPIKATLQDVFSFSRQQRCPSSASDCLLTSPLVSLDAIQVKRGLIQILEALHYLHAICKLVHRNVTPGNILIAATNDNWKLSGLQFAIRFESATISESASIMASEGSNMLRYSSTSGAASGPGAQSCSAAKLRRQRTLHQTKCEEFARTKPRTGGGILQPEVDYLAPEIWKSAKCSHKSDLFSYGLILGQTYDLFRHRPPISCRSNVDSYERELKKLGERRKLKLSRLVPLEMREPFLMALECEPQLRPSANYALQLFRRPIELCKANDDSLRHLRRSLRYLDQLSSSFASGSQQQQQPSAVQQTNSTSNNNNPPSNISAAAVGGVAPGKRGRGASYFKKVTCQAANQAPRSRQQSKTLHLLNLLLRGVDSLVQLQAAGGSTPSEESTSSSQFAALQSQFEHTYETLRQLFRVQQPSSFIGSGASNNLSSSSPTPIGAEQNNRDELASLFAASKPADQRSLMLVIALHRRLLDQVARMRHELPPVCRLAAPHSPLNRPTPRHRALAEMEEKLYCLVSRDSLRKLSPILTDPLLKLDEFLLLYELMGDLFAFVGQKCRQNFLQRGKQLLNELTPITGCPSSSSSDEEEEDDDDNNHNEQQYISVDQQQHDRNTRQLLGASRETLTTQDNQLITFGQMAHSNSNQFRRFSEYPDSHQLTNNPADQHQQLVSRQHRASAGDYLLQQPPLPTRISITAPSPMGSMRDINSNNHHQQQQQQNRSARSSVAELCDRTSNLSMNKHHHHRGSSHSSETTNEDEETAGHERSRSASDQGIPSGDTTAHVDKSRSQLIDELLRTINDDSFTADYQLNFNTANKQQHQHHRAATTTSSSIAGLQQNSQQQQSASQLANMNRPKSAMDGTQMHAQSSSSSGGRPNSLALSSQSQRQQRPSATPTSTFDNVIRRMSTNLVQNFNIKVTQNSNQPDSNNRQSSTCDISQQHQDNNNNNSSSNNSNVRREKSSNYAATNSLYVDQSQVPARRHSDNTINIPRIQVALSSPQTGNSRFGLNQRASVSASKLANKWKLSTKTNQRPGGNGNAGEASDKLSPNLSGALGYMRRHSSGNTTGGNDQQSNGASASANHHHQHHQHHHGGQTSTSNLLLNASPFKTKSSSNLGLDFLLSNRSMKRRYSAASMLGHQTQRKAENLIDAGMKSVQNMFG